ncbi:MAG TPA: hypothetical protein VGD68_03945 [Streptosporangiaceae bacterium]
MTDGLQPLIQALARVGGALGEVATVWRRAAPERPGLPLQLPLQLADSARRLADSLRDGPAGVAGRLAALEREITAAAALTGGLDSRAGDAGLWAYAGIALDQAREYAEAVDPLPLAS